MVRPLAPYSPIVRAGEWLAVSGQVGLHEGQLVTGGLAAELDQALRNMAALLAGEGATIEQVVKTTVFLLHMRDYQIMNDTYQEFFGAHRPARSAVAVSELPIGALVEVEAWAHLGG